ncbi:hypothetical protein K3495_g8463 [Podosphaera aphanis]|nr:hypothetical protein K3495_g8463 [Podosphaera aphanis]
MSLSLCTDNNNAANAASVSRIKPFQARPTPQLDPIVTGISKFEPCAGSAEISKSRCTLVETTTPDSQSKSFADLPNSHPSIPVPSKPEPSYQNRASPVHDVSQSSCSSPASPKLKNAARLVLQSSRSSMKILKSKPQQTSTMELTPLSLLLKQSYQDIEMLRSMRMAQTPNDSFSSSNSGNSREGANSLGNVPIRDQRGNEVDFERIEQNLRRFGDLYTQFLKDGGDEGKPAEEVHLVAMVCKRSEMATNTLGAGAGTPKLKSAENGV